MKRTVLICLASVLAIAGAAAAAPAADAAPGESARLMVVQALPGQTLDVDIDARSLAEGSETGSVLGPFTVPSGMHHVTFRDGSGDVVLNTLVELEPGASQDLVVHLPAEVEGAPVATLYTTPTESIGEGKARVLIAHTASVAPADVRLDGAVVFTNIANGEFATADVPGGGHVAELLPSGLTTRPILGPIDVTLPAATATMVYAVGDTQSDSMEVIAHSIPLQSKDAEAPTTIDAGTAGLASGIDVKTFSSSSPAVELAGDDGRGALAAYGLALLGLLALALAAARRRRFAADVPS